MKIFSRKKSVDEGGVAPATSSEPDQSFYTQRAGEDPLSEFSEYGRQTRRTSLHSPARRRETSNRAGNREIFFLLFRAGLIALLIAAGFLALRFVLGLLVEPSEKEKEEWAANAALMERGATAELLSPGGEDTLAQTQVITTDLIGKRLRQWAEAERQMRAAEMRERDGLDEEAILCLGKALHSIPDHRAAQRLLMKIHMRLGAYAEAIPLCVRLLDQNSRQEDVKLDLLRALQQMNLTEACLVLADQMLEKTPNDVDILQVSAFAHRVAGNADKALRLFDRILQNDTLNPEALSVSGEIYRERGEWGKAVSYYLELVRAYPDAGHYHNLARCYARQREAGKAIIFASSAESVG